MNNVEDSVLVFLLSILHSSTPQIHNHVLRTEFLLAQVTTAVMPAYQNNSVSRYHSNSKATVF